MIRTARGDTSGPHISPSGMPIVSAKPRAGIAPDWVGLFHSAVRAV
jgi:hypothetical protein